MKLKDRLALEIGNLTERTRAFWNGDPAVSPQAIEEQRTLVTYLLVLIPDDVTDQIFPHAVEEAPHD